MQLSDNFYQHRRLEQLVENQTSYSCNNAEMHVFETHQQADKVLLRFDQPVLATMLQGKKVMHLNDRQSFDFLPGESLILPASELMCIDFPEAQMDNPTRCLAMAISEDKIRHIVALLNENMPKADRNEWQFTDYNFHFTNDVAIHQIIHRLLFLFTEDHPSKDIFADFMLQELVMRILQAETKKIYTEQVSSLSNNNRMAFIIRYIRENLDLRLSVEALSKKACMSESNFHRTFKNELGMSPVDFINNERFKRVKSMLLDPEKTIKEISLATGFSSLSYFVRFFKKKTGMTPTAYKKYQQKMA